MSPIRAVLDRVRGDDPSLSRAEAFELLSNRRRRGVIHQLRASEGDGVEVDELIDAVVAWETGQPRASVDEAQRASVYSSLVQTHFPRLEAAGVIVHDEERGVIEPTPGTREMELYLEYSPRSDIPWAEYYLGLGAVGAALLAVVWASVPPFDALSPALVAGALVVVLLLSAVAHLVETRRSRLVSESFEESLDGR